MDADRVAVCVFYVKNIRLQLQYTVKNIVPELCKNRTSFQVRLQNLPSSMGPRTGKIEKFSFPEVPEYWS